MSSSEFIELAREEVGCLVDNAVLTGENAEHGGAARAAAAMRAMIVFMVVIMVVVLWCCSWWCLLD